jgi:hypothetical protein
MNRNHDVRPVPDPTILTTEQLVREILHLKEFVMTRFDAMDKAMTLFNDNITRVPTDTDKQIQHLKELHDEKFGSIQVQFAERDTRTEQTSRDNKVAVDAALQAAKEAVGEQNKSSGIAISKSEASTSKQIDQLVTMITTTTKGTDDKIDDIKDRLTRIEGKGEGADKAQTVQYTSSSYTVAVIGIVIAALGILAGVVIGFLRG